MSGFQRGGGGGGGQGVRTPPEKWPKIGFLCILVRFPLKSLKLPSQHSMLGHQSAKRHLNGVSLAGQWWPAFTLSHHQLKKKLSKLPPHRTKLSGWVIMFYVCFHVPRPPRGNNNSGGFDLRHHAVLETLSAADNISWQFGPRSGPTKCLMFLLIRLCGAQADLRLRCSHTTKSGCIHLQTCGKETKFCYVSIISRSSNFHGRKIHP